MVDPSPALESATSTAAATRKPARPRPLCKVADTSSPGSGKRHAQRRIPAMSTSRRPARNTRRFWNPRPWPASSVWSRAKPKAARSGAANTATVTNFTG